MKLGKIILVLVVAASVAVLLGNAQVGAPEYDIDIPEQSEPESVNTREDRELTEVREFTAEEFKQAFDSLGLPNIQPIIEPPEITGNIAADNTIRAIAESRGYELQQVASGILNEIEDWPVQELLIQDWIELQNEAALEGVIMQFVSGYRSIDDQRDLFLSRLYGAGATAEGVASGSQDDLVRGVLVTAAPPGYSRHHSGYTIDIKDPSSSIFGNSTAYAWLAANNFERAKEHGFIPSYPEGLTNQGPNPEPWEFVWVGKSVTYQ